MYSVVLGDLLVFIAMAHELHVTYENKSSTICLFAQSNGFRKSSKQNNLRKTMFISCLGTLKTKCKHSRDLYEEFSNFRNIILYILFKTGNIE